MLIAFVGVQPIIATLIFFISGWGITQVLANGNLQTFTNPPFTWLGTGRILSLPVQGWIASTLADLAGLIVVAINSASDAARIGQLMELDAIAAAVVGGAALSGGRAPVVGTLLGAVFIQLMGFTLIANGISDEMTLIVTAAIIAMAVWLQSGRRR